MRAFEVGRGDLAKRAKVRRTNTQKLMNKALSNGIRITFSAKPTEGEVALAKDLRKQANTEGRV